MISRYTWCIHILPHILFSRKDTYMTISHPLTRLQKFRLLSLIPIYFMIVGLFLQPVTEIIPGFPNHRLLSDRRDRDFLYQRRSADSSLHLDDLFSRNGDGRTHDHVELPDVRVFPFWKEPFKYLGNSSRRIPLFPLSQKTHVQLHLHRFLRH